MKLPKLPEFDARFRRRVLMALVGVLLCSFSVGFFRLSNFGTDPYQTFCGGLSNVLPWGFGNVMTAVNCLLLVETFLLGRRYLGIATIFTVFLTGYVVEFSEWLLLQTGIAMTLPVRIGYLIVGVVVMCFASSLYITSDLGVSSYDSQALMLADTKIAPFRLVRIGTDLVCVGLGTLMGARPGVGTIVTALCMGPLIDFFNRRVAQPFLERAGK